MRLRTLLAALLGGLSVTDQVSAALFDRGNGLVYDDVLRITWLQDAHLAASESFAVASIVGGYMNWDTAQAFIAAMNASAYKGFTNWRLPTVMPLDGAAFNYRCFGCGDGSGDLGINISAPSARAGRAHCTRQPAGDEATGRLSGLYSVP